VDPAPGSGTCSTINLSAKGFSMNVKTLAIAAAIGGMLAAGASPVFAADSAKEKCYGVAKAGQNDCASGSHSCAGQSKADMSPTEWKYVPAGECEKMGGTLEAGKKM
jgi:uncharacterized membrane protein